MNSAGICTYINYVTYNKRGHSPANIATKSGFSFIFSTVRHFVELTSINSIIALTRSYQFPKQTSARIKQTLLQRFLGSAHCAFMGVLDQATAIQLLNYSTVSFALLINVYIRMKSSYYS